MITTFAGFPCYYDMLAVIGNNRKCDTFFKIQNFDFHEKTFTQNGQNKSRGNPGHTDSCRKPLIPAQIQLETRFLVRFSIRSTTKMVFWEFPNECWSLRKTSVWLLKGFLEKSLGQNFKYRSFEIWVTFSIISSYPVHIIVTWKSGECRNHY